MRESKRLDLENKDRKIISKTTTSTEPKKNLYKDSKAKQSTLIDIYYMIINLENKINLIAENIVRFLLDACIKKTTRSLKLKKFNKYFLP